MFKKLNLKIKAKISEDRFFGINYFILFFNIFISIFFYLRYRIFFKDSHYFNKNFYNLVFDKAINIKFKNYFQFSINNDYVIKNNLFFILLKIRRIKITKILKKNIELFFDINSGNYQKRKNKLILFIKRSSTNNTSPKGWQVIYLFFISLKENEISSYFFEKMQSSILSSNKFYKKNNFNYKITNIFFLTNNYNKDNNIYKNIKNYLNKYEANNTKFSKLIKGKKIAIIGPANYQYEIDINQYDIIIRFNVRDLKNKFKIIDMIYYNKSKSRDIEDYNFLNYYQTKFAIFKNIKIPSDPKLEFRKMKTFEMGVYSQLNMLQTSILDLLIYKPKQIKLFNFSFFININQSLYEENYQLEKYKNLLIEKMFLKHNPITQFLLVKTLYDNNLIDLDENIKKIINLNYKDFAKKLDYKTD